LKPSATRRFYRLSLFTLVAVYFLVLVGGIVRSTGSGMGCPDWPKCFGQWVPPTSVSQLPENYKEQYAAYRDKKNQKFARYLSFIGLQDTAKKILEDKSILVEADFNATKTWVEYTNRLVGVAIGLMIIGLFIASWRTRTSHPALFRGSMLALILVIIQGWLGSVVVSTNLTSWTVTIHMFLALLIVAVLVWLMVRSGVSKSFEVDKLNNWLAFGLIALLVQIFLGTEVREKLDRLSTFLPRDEWIGAAGVDFVVHRTFSWAMPIIVLVIWVKVRKTTAEKSLTVVPFLLILSSLITGAAMAWFAVPPLLQPIHLLMAVVTFGWFYQLYLQSKGNSGNPEPA
jgi:cytochrome c oxidase assembly protein subunit 15